MAIIYGHVFLPSSRGGEDREREDPLALGETFSDIHGASRGQKSLGCALKYITRLVPYICDEGHVFIQMCQTRYPTKMIAPIAAADQARYLGGIFEGLAGEYPLVSG